MPQFDIVNNRHPDYRNISKGLFLFTIGLAKKVLIADKISLLANCSFDNTQTITFIEAWLTSLAYTMQIYFDFSGYTDMALGASLILNIKLPINFNSPYKSVTIQEFWRRWHITLSRFLRDYVYKPLGGSRITPSRTILNIIVTFLIGGFWHGAGWTFILWGALHGAALSLQRLCERVNFVLPNFIKWFLTFNFINLTWIFFKAANFQHAFKMLKGLFGFNGIALPSLLEKQLGFLKRYGIVFADLLVDLSTKADYDDSIIAIILLVIGSAIALFFKNSNTMTDEFKPDMKYALFISALFIASIINMTKGTVFLYFNF
jgi:D-alanyl-lipoteichoic acid acyltransferase DltB (MBOAT superfamily)